MQVGVATDHGGFRLKEDLVPHLRKAGDEVVDFGADSINPGDDYPDFVIPPARAVSSGQVERGLAAWRSVEVAWAHVSAPTKFRGFGLAWFRTTTRLTRESSTTI